MLPGQVSEMALPSVTQEYGPEDLILYALGLGYGENPLDRDELRFVYERDIEAVPSMCSVLCRSSAWLRDPERRIDWRRVIHAQESFVIHRTIAPEGRLWGSFDITSIEDKGPSKGALLHLRRELHDADDGALVAVTQSALLLQGDGGRGGFGTPPPAFTVTPKRAPDRIETLRISPRAALIYRLNGDMNPLHVDPDAARLAGFDRPVLHGLCTSGMACRAILSAYCAHNPKKLRGMSVRFTKPVYPGENLQLEFYERPGRIEFRARVIERNAVVLDGGSVALDGSRRV
jgi:acyl dehydratase